jgi:hypothetical protein
LRRRRVDASLWIGALAPRGTPPEAVIAAELKLWAKVIAEAGITAQD